MKPSHLKTPFSWEEPKVLLEDRILYVPERCDYSQFDLPEWCSAELFGNNNPIHIEYCSGNGTWIAERAAMHPDCNWIAVEKKFVRVRKIWSKIKNYQLNNLIVICGEALQATRTFLPSAFFEGAYINFPDPWPKNYHAKNRLIKPEFVQEIWRILKPQTSFTLVTDDQKYSTLMIKEMGRNPGFQSIFPPPYYTTELSNYGTSTFEQLWRGQGKHIFFHRYQKQ